MKVILEYSDGHTEEIDVENPGIIIEHNGSRFWQQWEDTWSQEVE